MSDLRKKVIHLANTKPELRPFLIPLLKGASLDEVLSNKIALNKEASPTDTGAFAAWAILSNPTGMTETEVKKSLTTHGVSIKEPTDGGPAISSKRGPLEVGEIVLVDASKCVNPNNKKNCEALGFNPATPVYLIVKDVICPAELTALCTVVLSPILDGKVSSKVFNFEASYPTRIAGLTKDLEKATKKGDVAKIQEIQTELREKSLTPHDGLGIYRTGYKNLSTYLKYLEMFEAQTKFVVVYERVGTAPIPAIRRDFVDTSVSARTRQTEIYGEFSDIIDHVESFSSRYYIGPVKYGAMSREGKLFFAMDTKLSTGSDTFFSPDKGTVYFMAPLSDLPSNWQSDLRARLADLVSEG